MKRVCNLIVQKHECPISSFQRSVSYKMKTTNEYLENMTEDEMVAYNIVWKDKYSRGASVGAAKNNAVDMGEAKDGKLNIDFCMNLLLGGIKLHAEGQKLSDAIDAYLENLKLERESANKKTAGSLDVKY